MHADDAELVARDPDLSGLPLLLDRAALSAWLGASVLRRYVRYKPGTACVLGLDVDGTRCFAVAYADDAGGKLDKAVQASPEGSVVAVDRTLGVLVARPAADRDLPALAALDDDLGRALRRTLRGRDLTGAGLRTLAQKPQRRWVGRLDVPGADPVVLRAHRPDDADATVGALRVLDGSRATTPRLLGSDPRLGLVAVSWLPGEGLHDLLARGAATEVVLRATGAALAELHEGELGGLVVRTTAEDVDAVQRAAAAVADLLPGLAEEAAGLADRLERLLAEGTTGPVAAHGDLSADQVVVAQDGRTGLVDLDRACAAEAELDLGSAVAALHADALAAELPGTGVPRAAPRDVDAALAALLAGYGRPVDPHRLQVHTAAALLRRAVEPFRLCRDDWAMATGRLLALADATCPRPVRQ